VPADLSIAAKYSANNVADAYRQVLAAELEALHPTEKKGGEGDEDEDGEEAAAAAAAVAAPAEEVVVEGGDSETMSQIAALKVENAAIKSFLGKDEDAGVEAGEGAGAGAELAAATSPSKGGGGAPAFTLDTLPPFTPPSPNSLKMMEGGQLGGEAAAEAAKARLAGG
jgi:hypothetical protein